MQSFQLNERASTVPPTLSYDREGWQKGYHSLKQEFDYWIDDIEGTIPPDLHGTLFRNGPGLLDVNGQRIHHPFDGDGMICAIAFDNGRAHFRNRFVRTEGYLAEQAAGRILYRGVFGTQKPGGWLANAFDFRLKNIANTNILYWGGKLLALWEAAEPHRLDPGTLETVGLEHFEGLLQSGEAFAAHPWIDPACNQDNGAPCLVNFSIKPGLSSTITLFEFDPAGKLLRKHAHATPGFAFIHDFAITPNCAIFFQNPVSFNPLPFLVGKRGPGECITFNPDKPTRIVVIPRKAKGGSGKDEGLTLKDKNQDSSFSLDSLAFETHAGFVFHHANAFEQGDEIVIDSVCYDALPAVEADSDFRQTDFEALSPGQLWRFRVNLKTQAVQRELLESRCCEFPYVHPAKAGRSHRYVFMGAAHAPEGNAPLQAITKIDVETGEHQLWSAAPHGYVSEPIFVPRASAAFKDGLPSVDMVGAEDDGWLLTLVYDSAQERSDVVILDARDLHRGPVARLHLKHHVPYGLHGSFTPEVF
ncbi:MAG: carotenoid oxygenase family protein [Leptolyngbya sp. BL-A-14]